MVARCISYGPSPFPWGFPNFIDNQHGRWTGLKNVPKKYISHDTGVIIILDKKALYPCYQDKNIQKIFTRVPLDRKYWNWFWNPLGKGCQQIYEFAIKHHIKVIDYHAFLEGNEVER